MSTEERTPTFRKDYTEFDFSLEDFHIRFQIFDSHTLVTSTGRYRKKSHLKPQHLQLMGEKLELAGLSLDGRELPVDRYRIEGKTMKILNPPDYFTLTAVTRIYPEKNTSLQGLYKSGGNYCTQCEAEGFRRITYFPDRPDVLTIFTTRVEADSRYCPQLLSNGNLMESGDLEGGRHFVVWQDPYPKPSYLFALVAGRLECISDRFVTRSGREVDLKIFVEERNKLKCDHAMKSIKKAMRWDEEVYGLEYDLDTFMVVAVDDFNMGAMENKGLNIFNSKYVLSTPETATDMDYLGIQGVIGHEYFHNWTGNRVTCRDWFQLSLKEGLTMFRDQEFSSDIYSRPVKRIQDVRLLRDFQFKEDSSPMAHPVRPDSYMEINNFYTVTIYNKGAEVIRMMHTILGTEKFHRGMDLYFERYDGKAVTCDDFVSAMSDAGECDLTQFKLWYSQAGTPELTVRQEWDELKSSLKITIRQTCPATPGQNSKAPFFIPIKIGLLSESGEDLPGGGNGVETLYLTGDRQEFTFDNIGERPVLSFLRDFSAPVKVKPFQTRKELGTLMKYDTNQFNRWEAGNRYASDTVLDLVGSIKKGKPAKIDAMFLEALLYNLKHHRSEPALLAQTLSLPGETTLAQEMAEIDPDALHLAVKMVRREIADKGREQFLEILKEKGSDRSHSISASAIGQRSLANAALSYLMAVESPEDEILRLCLDQYHSAANMTDTIAALTCLANMEHPSREEVLHDFYEKWRTDPLVMDKWLAIQANSELPSTLENVKKLLRDPVFSMGNPNKVRSLIGVFCTSNHVQFHRINGEGYIFLTDIVLDLDQLNPQIAARLVSPLINWKRYDKTRGGLMKTQLQRVAGKDKVSRDVYEIVSKSLS
jgi:aminopeptidase N